MKRLCLLALSFSLFTFHVSLAADFYAAPQAFDGADGGNAAPWGFADAIGSFSRLSPGDTLYLTEGTYQAPWVAGQSLSGWQMRLKGEQAKRITIRPVPGEKVLIDGGITVHQGGDVTLRDLELTCSQPKGSPAPGKKPDRHHGGLIVITAPRFEAINLKIRDATQGVSIGEGAPNSLLYGLIITSPGWIASDGRGHGHAIYTQNKEPTQTIEDCILADGTAYSLHAYGEQARVDHYRIKGNMAFGFKEDFLVGGQIPSKGIVMTDNGAVGRIKAGRAKNNEDLTLTCNFAMQGTVQAYSWKTLTSSGNLFAPKDKPLSSRPTGVSTLFRPNRYDPNRAHVGIFNWRKAATVTLPTGDFLKSGDAWQLLDPRDLDGMATFSGTYDGTPIRLPHPGEFGCYVMKRN